MFEFFKRSAPQTKENPVGKVLVITNGKPSWMNRNKGAFAKEGYIQNAVVYACVTKIATAISTLDICLYKTVGDKKVKIETHKILDLLKRPSPLVSGVSFLEAAVSNILIYGEAAILRAPPAYSTILGTSAMPPQELWGISPIAVTPLEGKSGMPLGYLIGLTGEKIELPVNQVNGNCDLLFLKKFHPLSEFCGLSPMEAAAYSTDIFNSGQQWNKSLLDNGARPSGALTIKNKKGESNTLTDEQYARLKEELETNYNGARNAGKPLLLEGGLEWIEMSLNPKDMDYKENLFTAARWIASAYGVPPQLVNIPGEQTYNNLAEAKIAFYTDTVLPLAYKIISELNHWLVPMFDASKSIALEVDEDCIAALEPRREILYKRANEATFLTINEKRRMTGMDDIAGGDVVLVDAGKVPLDMAGVSDPAGDSYDKWAAANKKPKPKPDDEEE